MLTYLRYALAAVCFAASVGCLALSTRSDIVRHANGDIALVSVEIGSARVQVWRGNLYAALGTPVGLALIDHPVAMERWGRTTSRLDRFTLTQDAIVCPPLVSRPHLRPRWRRRSPVPQPVQHSLSVDLCERCCSAVRNGGGIVDFQ